MIKEKIFHEKYAPQARIFIKNKRRRPNFDQTKYTASQIL